MSRTVKLNAEDGTSYYQIYRTCHVQLAENKLKVRLGTGGMQQQEILSHYWCGGND